MSDLTQTDWVRERVTMVLQKEFGKADEDLVGTGLIDSVRAIDIALIFEQEFDIQLEGLMMVDMMSISSLSKKITEILDGNLRGVAA